MLSSCPRGFIAIDSSDASRCKAASDPAP
jgi:hypothetical protein